MNIHLVTTQTKDKNNHEFFVKHPRERTLGEADEIKALTDVRYNKPAITAEELMQARVHMVFLIDVDSATTQELDPETYVRTSRPHLDWRGVVLGTDQRRGPVEGGFNLKSAG